MIAIIDYGAGNIFSVKNALDYLGLAGELTSDPEAIRKADALILPGVGAFPSAMQMLHDSGLTNIIQEEAHKKPFLGICLGMQLIFEKGYEFEESMMQFDCASTIAYIFGLKQPQVWIGRPMTQVFK